MKKTPTPHKAPTKQKAQKKQKPSQKPPSKAIVDEFQTTARALFQRIHRFKEELHQREVVLKKETIGVKPLESGADYQKNIVIYHERLLQLRDAVSTNFHSLASHVTSSIQFAADAFGEKDPQVGTYRTEILLGLNSSLVPLGGRPSKKFAAMILDSHNNLLHWDVNHLCPGVPMRADMFVKGQHGGRGKHITCAEQNVLFRFLRMSAMLPHTEDLDVIHQAVNHFRISAAGAATNHELLKSYTLVSSHFPCSLCSEVLAPRSNGNTDPTSSIGELIAYWSHKDEAGLEGPARDTAGSRKYLERSGVTLTILER